MKEPHRKGVANHPDPESCAGGGNIAGEALTGAHAGQPLSSEITSIGVPTLCCEGEGHTTDTARRKVPAAAESVEERGPTKGNATRILLAPDTAPGKRGMGLWGVREAAKRDKKQRFSNTVTTRNAACGNSGAASPSECVRSCRDQAAVDSQMHRTMIEVGAWLRSVVRGWFNYHAVPGNLHCLDQFRTQVARLLAARPATAQSERATLDLGADDAIDPTLAAQDPRSCIPIPNERLIVTNPR